MAEQYITLHVVHDRVTQHPLMASIPFDAILRYTIDFMRILGVPRIYVEKVVKEKSDDKGRVKLPCDYIDLIQMRGPHGAYRYSSDTFHMAYEKGLECRQQKQSDGGETQLINVHRENDEFVSNTTAIVERHTHPHCYGNNGDTFIIQNGYIYITRKHEPVEISYHAILTDPDGLPMVPDNSKFLRALVAYIKQEYFTILYDTGIVNDKVFNQAQQDYAWAVGACETEFQKLDLSRAESFFNSLNSMIQHNNQFNHSFRANNVKTELRGV